MELKVGDKVKIKDNLKDIDFFQGVYVSELEEYIGQICTITSFSCNKKAVEVKENEWLWDIRALEKISTFTKSDLKDEDIVTYRNGDRRTVKGNYLIDRKGLIVNDLGKYTKDLKGKQGTDYMDIIKVERPVKYETVFERREEILDETEKEYLKAVIRPFRDKVKRIIKEECKNKQYIAIDIKDDSSIDLPVFDKDTMYKNMKAGYTYSLEKLGL